MAMVTRPKPNYWRRQGPHQRLQAQSRLTVVTTLFFMWGFVTVRTTSSTPPESHFRPELHPGDADQSLSSRLFPLLDPSRK